MQNFILFIYIYIYFLVTKGDNEKDMRQNSSFLLSSFNPHKNTPEKWLLDWTNGFHKFSKRTFPPFMTLSTTCRDVWTEPCNRLQSGYTYRYQPEWNLRWRSRFNNAPAPRPVICTIYLLHRCILRNFIDDELVR